MKESVIIEADYGIQNLNRPSVLRSGEKNGDAHQNYFSSPAKHEVVAPRVLNFHQPQRNEPV
jgi:hypothetical protein